MNDLLTIIVNYNGKKYLKQCLESILGQTYKCLDILVVDNHSEDGTDKYLSDNFPNVKVIELSDNIGFAGANNVGIQYALHKKYKYVMLLNNDTELASTCIEILMSKMQETGIAVPKMYFGNGSKRLWYDGGYLDKETGKAVHCNSEKTDRFYSKQRIVEFAPACCIMLRTDILRTTGKMCEDYFLYYEDTDYSLRLKRKGYRTLYVPNAVLWHNEGSTTKKHGTALQSYYLTRNYLYYVKNNRDILLIPWYKQFLVVKERFLRTADIHDKLMIVNGVWDFMIGKKGKR